MTVTSSSTISLLRTVADSYHWGTLASKVYLFGSSLHSSSPSDIDVLIVYPAGQLDAAHLAAEYFRRFASSPPLEVVALSDVEEAEMNFVASVQAVPVWEHDGSATNRCFRPGELVRAGAVRIFEVERQPFDYGVLTDHITSGVLRDDVRPRSDPSGLAP